MRVTHTQTHTYTHTHTHKKKKKKKKNYKNLLPECQRHDKVRNGLELNLKLYFLQSLVLSYHVKCQCDGINSLSICFTTLVITAIFMQPLYRNIICICPGIYPSLFRLVFYCGRFLLAWLIFKVCPVFWFHLESVSIRNLLFRKKVLFASFIGTEWLMRWVEAPIVLHCLGNENLSQLILLPTKGSAKEETWYRIDTLN